MKVKSKVEEPQKLLEMPKLTEHDVFGYVMERFSELKNEPSMDDLVTFHTNNKYLLMAHSQSKLKTLGNLVANHKKLSLKKILENDNRQKELAKREFYEKPSAKKQRNMSQAKKRHQKDRMKSLISGDAPLPQPSSQKFMKSKRKRRAYSDLRNAFANSKRKRGTL